MDHLAIQSALVLISRLSFLDSPHKIFIGGLPNYLNEEQVCPQLREVPLFIALWMQFFLIDASLITLGRALTSPSSRLDYLIARGIESVK